MPPKNKKKEGEDDAKFMRAARFGRVKNDLKMGFVGLPNVGKSTLTNLLAGANHAEAANYPFCTIGENCLADTNCIIFIYQFQYSYRFTSFSSINNKNQIQIWSRPLYPIKSSST